ncbi:MAG: hypothetical protein U1F08_04065 [Steroidobacteraceae bacterium]
MPALIDRIPPAPAGLLAALLLAGCSQTSVHSESHVAAPAGAPYARVLVVGISPDEKFRCRYERFLAAKINGEGTKSVASCDAVDQVQPLTRESIQKAVDWLKVDAVVATSLVAHEWAADERTGRDQRGTAGYKATDAGIGYYGGWYGVYGVPVVYGEFVATPPVTTLSGTVELTTKVYSTTGPTLVYSIETRTKKQDWVDRSYSGVTVPIADRLRRDGLIR